MEVLLPSGYRARGVIPGFTALARRGLLDQRVQAAVVALAPRDAVSEQEDDEASLYTGLDALVAGFLRETLDPGDDPETGEWKWARLTLDDLDNIDQRDRQVLQMLVLRLRTAADITAEVERGEYDPEGAGDLDSLAEFRDDADSPADRGDGEGVEPAPVGAAAGGG